jgi:hypothetical protein
MSVEQVGEAARGPTGGNAHDEAHAAEHEAALLAASSPDHKANTDAEPFETTLPSATVTKAKV